MLQQTYRTMRTLKILIGRDDKTWDYGKEIFFVAKTVFETTRKGKRDPANLLLPTLKYVIR